MTKRPESAQTGRTAVNAVKQVLNELNWVANELFEDFGIDLHVKVFESTGERKALPWEFHIQVKGTTSLQRSKGFVLYAIDTEHLCDWQASPLPVLFVVYDVKSRVGYWIRVKDYMESLAEGWHVDQSKVLRIPSADVVTRDGLLEAFRRIRRATLIHEAARAIESMRQPSQDMMGYEQGFLKGDLEPIPPPSASVQDPALAICIACKNIFWIDESWAAGHDVPEPDEPDMPQNLDFTKTYYPTEHEPSVYMCDSPENSCPFCKTGRGALCKCAGCGRYRVLEVSHSDPTRQSEELCWECLEGTS